MTRVTDSRKGIQLSVNVLVVIILGIVLLVLGITLVTNMVSQGQEYTQKVDQQLMDQLRQSQFSDGRLVAVLSPQKRVSPGEHVEFLLGFRNNEDDTHGFRVVVKFNEDSSPVGDALGSTQEQKAREAVLYFDGEQTLPPNEEHFQWIRVTPPSGLPSGEYFYDVYVCYTGTAYDEHDTCKSLASEHKELYSGSKHSLFVSIR